MTMPQSAQQMIHELSSAGLLSSAEVTHFNQEVAMGAEALIDRLLQDSRITPYQARKFLAGQSADICFGDYIVLEELGRGGMGTVLLARHRRMDRKVAIKILSVNAFDTEASIARFYQEVKVAAQLTHPNIVTAYDAGEHNGFHYLVMEYVPGHDLAHVLEQLGPIPVNLAVDYIAQAAKGLEYAHRKGIIHRDIKPSNLLLNDEGTVKILDMGLARLGHGIGGRDEPSVHLTTTGQVMGTIEYMSPEQAEDTRLADARSDIYSLGCTLYRLVTGKAPFARDTMVKTILAHRESPIPNLSSSINPAMARIEPLFRAMVAKNPDDRIQTSTALIQKLERLSQELDTPSVSEIVETDIEVVDTGRSSSADQPTLVRDSIAADEISFTSDVIESDVDLRCEPASAGQGNRTGSDPGVDHPTRSSITSTTPTVSTPISEPGQNGSHDSWSPVKPHRGRLILFMGIASLLFAFVPCLHVLGLILAVVTWIYARSDLREIQAGTRDPGGNTLTQAGRVLAIVACIIGGLWTLSPLLALGQ